MTLPIPDYWITAKFTEILDVQGGTQPPKSEFIDTPKDGYVRLLQIRDFGNKPVPTYIPDTKKLKKCEKHDLLIGRYGASLGRICFGMEGAYNVALAKVQKTNLLNSKFLKAYLESELFQAPLSLLSRSAQNGFNKEDLSTFDFFLPPLAEQKIIAEKLDTLLAQVATTKARLERTTQTLKRFRQSVLAAAVSGKLTEEWRSGDNPERDFKKLGDAGVGVKTGPFGSTLHKSDYISGGIPVINPMHISEGAIQPSESMTIPHQKYISLEAWHLRKGDVVVGRRGEMGRAAVVDSEKSQLCGTGSMILRVASNALPKYLEIILRSPTAVSYFNSASVGSTMVNLNQKVIKNLEVYFPALAEQTEIVRRVEQLFAYADSIEQQVQAALARVNNLTQSILAKAFRGELTADWRKNNPELISGENSAEALLEKIKAEREAMGKIKRIKV